MKKKVFFLLVSLLFLDYQNVRNDRFIAFFLSAQSSNGQNGKKALHFFCISLISKIQVRAFFVALCPLMPVVEGNKYVAENSWDCIACPEI